MKRILIVKLGAIGDVIMALPLAQQLLSDPNVQLDWLVGQVSEPILRCVDLPRFTIKVADERALFRGSLIERVKAIFCVWKQLGLGAYDEIFLMNGDKRYGLLPLFCLGKRRWFRRAAHFRGTVPGRHHSAEYVRMATEIDDSRMSPPTYPELKLPELDPAVDAWIRGFGKPFIAISPAGAKNVMREEGLRRWPVERFRETMRELRANGIPVVLVGGPGDEWAAAELSGDFDLDLTGKLPLAQFLSFLKRAALLITHDSGPLHMGDLVGTPIIGVFGPTSPDEKRPIFSQNWIFWGGASLPCRPCYDGRHYAACTAPVCLTDTHSNQVATKALWYLNLP